jgi:uncharacterized protein
MWKSVVVALVAMVGLMSPASSGTRYEGKAAYERGDFAAALEIWKPLAEAGDEYSQYELGLIYAYGKGVPVDYAEAQKWYRIAAENGYAFAEVGLANLYLHGQGVTPDIVQAYMWLALADIHGDRDAGDSRDKVARQMTPEQIAAAQALVKDWAPTPK